MHAKTLAYQFELSSKVLEMNIKDVSHEESLIKPPKGGSCLNQVLGHITRTRNLALSTIGHKEPFSMEDFDPYDDRTRVPFSPEKSLPFDELRRRFKAMQEPLVHAINGMSPEVLASRPPRNMTGDQTRPSAATSPPSSSMSATTWDKRGYCGGWRASRGW